MVAYLDPLNSEPYIVALKFVVWKRNSAYFAHNQANGRTKNSEHTLKNRLYVKWQVIVVSL